ncbi:TPA: type IV secretion protein Rhs [Escherichia coli]|nr:type IV secretion protein Rhs [Escherichia coli]EIV7084836.1 AHH domain-containing protein [Escherichia coli]EJY0870686.1 AHH domain-containing protein [Escherichia coli]ELX1826584.1 AHH domain-containing protein [Escherichia coli]MBA8370486.1 AHH domain-containing protein [Escherichia coli]
MTARDYIWNADGEVGGINDKLRGCLVFSYDRSGWLTSRTGQMYDHDHYYYDKAGNLLTDEYQSAVMDNRLPGYGRDRYRYNEWGELTERRDQQLEWNAQGQLTRVISSNSETRYQYDALGRRISKATSNLHTDRGERSRTTFVWEGVRLLQETTWQGKRTYLYDAEQPYTPVAAITGRGESRKIWYYHTDLTGTVQEVTAADGTLVWAGYQAGFGENRGDISNSGAYFEQPLRLPGQYYDEETGLHYNLFRYYAPECGRFVSQDPISIRGGLNLYRYAPNPITWIDPWGLAKGDYGKMPTFPGWQKHHNIPQNMATHSAIVDSGFDIHNSRNITTLPKTGSIDTARTVHSGMHTGDYDRMVKNALDQIDSLNASPEIKKMHIEALSDDIGNKLRTKQITLNAAC